MASPPPWLHKHTDLRAYEFAHSPHFLHQPRLAALTCTWSWRHCRINPAIFRLSGAPPLSYTTWPTNSVVKQVEEAVCSYYMLYCNKQSSHKQDQQQALCETTQWVGRRHKKKLCEKCEEGNVKEFSLRICTPQYNIEMKQHTFSVCNNYLFILLFQMLATSIGLNRPLSGQCLWKIKTWCDNGIFRPKLNANIWNNNIKCSCDGVHILFNFNVIL
jgi:hypothetical protein